MRRIIPILLCLAAATTTHAATTAAGRWQGSVQIPGNAFEAIVDLAEARLRALAAYHDAQASHRSGAVLKEANSP